MLGRLNSWLTRRKIAAQVADFNRGFNYAAGALLRGEESPMSLEAKPWPGEFTHFDKGMIAAIDKLVATGVITDDR